jgi:predicted phosphoserine aminotransferase
MKLLTPGPVDVRPEILEEMKKKMITHRSPEYTKLHKETIEKLGKLFYSSGEILLSTSSGTGLMEAAVRNCVKEKCLNLVCGAFGERWYEITNANGKNCDLVSVEWGKGVKADEVKEKIESGNFDAVAVTHNETSTGVMNHLKEIGDVLKGTDVLFLVDAVSSFGGVKINVDGLGIDVCLTSSQKCLGLPPGLSMCTVSERAMKKAETVDNRGFYFDFIEMKKYNEKNQTPVTPCIPQIRALNKQLDFIFEEGPENRFKRHEEMAEFVRGWAKVNFDLLAEPGYESNTLTAVKNTKGIHIEDLRSKLKAKGFVITNGYGKLKEKTFRIAHMADTTIEDLKACTEAIDEMIK